MGDPFGALATQRKGDVGVFNGHQYAASSQQTDVTAVFGVGSDADNFPNAKTVQFMDGTVTNPATHESPTVKIVRTEKITSPSHNGSVGYSSALYVGINSLVGNVNQATAITSRAVGYAAGSAYVISAFLEAEQTSNGSGTDGGAQAIFAAAKTTILNGTAQVIGTVTVNQFNVSVNYAAGGNGLVGVDALYQADGHTATVTLPVASPGVVNWAGHGLHVNSPVIFTVLGGGALPTGVTAGTTYYIIAAGFTANAFEIATAIGGGAINFTGSSTFPTQIGTSGPTYGGAGFQVRAAALNATFDVGYAVLSNSARTAGFRDDSSSTYGFYSSGDHGGAGMYIKNDNAAHYAQLWERTSATAALYGLTISAAGAIGIDEFGVANKFYITKGTPGANFTCLQIQEGAGPTLRRLKTFDPGAAGINFLGGELVCILV